MLRQHHHEVSQIAVVQEGNEGRLWNECGLESKDTTHLGCVKDGSVLSQTEREAGSSFPHSGSSTPVLWRLRHNNA